MHVDQLLDISISLIHLVSNVEKLADSNNQLFEVSILYTVPLPSFLIEINPYNISEVVLQSNILHN